MRNWWERNIVEYVLWGAFLVLFIIFCIIDKKNTLLVRSLVIAMIVLFIVIIIYSAFMCYYNYVKVKHRRK